MPLPGCAQLLAENQLKPKGLLATHGHFDHVASAAEIADEFNVPLWIHSADRHLLTEPAAGLSADGAAMLKKLLRTPDGRAGAGGGVRLDHRAEPRPPEVQRDARPGAHRGFRAARARLQPSRNPQINRLVFTGDVVFAGSVGRTDLPGGDPKVMSRTLSDVVLALPDTAALLPGHGAQTTMARERLENPYLQAATSRN